MENSTYIKVAFFDLGETLVTKDKSQPAGTEKWIWIPGAQELLTRLRNRDVRLGVISNTGDLKLPQLVEIMPQGLMDFFEKDLIILSGEVNAEKPKPEPSKEADPKIFQIAVERTGLDGGRCLFCTEELF